MRRSPLALAGAAVLATGLTFGGAGMALAQTDAPVPGTAECLQAVEATATVAQANDNLTAAQRTLTNKQGALEKAQGTLDSAKAEQKAAKIAVTDLKNKIAAAEAAGEATGALTNQLGAAQTTLDAKKAAVADAQDAVDEAQAAVNDAQSKVETAQSLLAQARVAATAQVCTGTTEESTEPAPSEEPAPPENPAPENPPADGQFNPGAIVTNPVDNEDCVNFPSQALAQAHLAADPTDPDNLDADNDGTACEDFFAAAGSTTVNNTEVNNGVLVAPLADDGSTAVTSGDEVTEVPQGSVQTGAA